MTFDELVARAEGRCEFCGSDRRLGGVDLPPAGAVLLCPLCRGDRAAPDAHWRCLEGAAWSQVPVVQWAVWRRLGSLDAAWAREVRDAMTLMPQVQAWIDTPGAVEHRDSNGVLLAQGDAVIVFKEVRGIKRGTVLRAIALVEDDATQIEGRVDGQKRLVPTSFTRKA